MEYDVVLYFQRCYYFSPFELIGGVCTFLAEEEYSRMSTYDLYPQFFVLFHFLLCGATSNFSNYGILFHLTDMFSIFVPPLQVDFQGMVPFKNPRKIENLKYLTIDAELGDAAHILLVLHFLRCPNIRELKIKVNILSILCFLYLHFYHHLTHFYMENSSVF